MGRKNSEHEHTNHVRQAAELLLQRCPNFEIIRIFQDKYNFKPRHIADIIAKAKKLIQVSDDEYKEVLNEYVAVGENLIYQAMKKGDIGRAISQFANMAKLRGLERTQVDVNHTGLAAPMIQIVLDRPQEQKTIDITPEVKKISEQ